jgi:hypothetical protein
MAGFPASGGSFQLDNGKMMTMVLTRQSPFWVPATFSNLTHSRGWIGQITTPFLSFFRKCMELDDIAFMIRQIAAVYRASVMNKK